MTIEDNFAKFYVTQNCIHWLRTVPSLVRDDKNWEDIADGEDHAGEATRFLLMTAKPFVPTGQKHWK